MCMCVCEVEMGVCVECVCRCVCVHVCVSGVHLWGYVAVQKVCRRILKASVKWRQGVMESEGGSCEQG